MSDLGRTRASELGTMWLVHGAGSGPWIFRGWEEHLPSWRVRCADLHAGVDVAGASMESYAEHLASLLAGTPPPRALVGWSMGGLVAMMAAGRVTVELLALLEPSPPGEVIGVRPPAVTSGVYDPEAEYGSFPAGVRARPESVLAREQRRAGIEVGALDCPLLVVCGSEFTELRGRAIATHWDGELLALSDFDHWELVVRPEVPAEIERWSRRVLASGCAPGSA